MKKLPELTENSRLRRGFGGQVKLKTNNLFRRNKLCLLLITSFVAVCYFVSPVHAQKEVAIPGPELEEVSFIEVKNLEIGDWVFIRGKDRETDNEKLIPEQITKLEYQQEPVEVYNLSVDGEETFFANDFAVHNKTPDRDPICFISLSPQVSMAASRGYTEVWSLNGVDGSLAKGSAFKNLFQYSGIGPGGGGFAKTDGNKICRYGQLINGCQYPPNKILPTGDSCRGCDKAYGTNCSTPASCNPQCEMTCGLYGYGHDASDRLRFRSAFIFCDGEYGCGAALKVTAPAGYVIKSMTYSSQIDMCNRPGCHASINLSRGMHWHLDDGMRPNAPIATLANGGPHTVQMGRATKYFFIYSYITSSDAVGNDLVDNRAEIWDIKLELIKISEVKETQIEVVNNSLIWYDPATHKVGEWDFRAVVDGTISFSNNGGQTWSSTRNIPDGSNYSYTWTLDPNNPCVTAKVTSSTGVNPSYCGACISYTPPVTPTPTGTITGNVYQNSEGQCSGTTDPPSGWKVECGNQTYGYYEAENQADGQSYKCKNKDGGYDLPYGTYIIRFKTIPDGWMAIFACSQDSVTLSATPDPPQALYLWQGARPWFQTQGGDVHAWGEIKSPIPPSATNKNFSVDLDNYPGLISYGGSSADFTPAGVVSSKGWLANNSLSLSYDYDSFYSKLGSPADNWSIDPDCQDLGNQSPNTTKVCYSSADASYSGDGFTLSGNKKLIVLVNGNLNINLNSNKIIKVETGSFLAFIVKKNINIDGNVGDKSSAVFDGSNAHLQGMYLAGEKIDTGDPTSGRRLVGAGLFYAKGGFNLRRELKQGGISDDTTPAELFIARPDLFVNIPEELKESHFFQQEVAP